MCWIPVETLLLLLQCVWCNSLCDLSYLQFMLLNSFITLLGKNLNLDLWQAFLPSLASSLLQSKVSTVNLAQGTVHHAFDVLVWLLQFQPAMPLLLKLTFISCLTYLNHSASHSQCCNC